MIIRHLRICGRWCLAWNWRRQ